MSVSDPTPSPTTDPVRVRSAYAAPALRRLLVSTRGASSDGTAAVLLLASPRLTDELYLYNSEPWDDEDGMHDVRFDGRCDLGGAVSSARCPLLQYLLVNNAQGLSNLAIHSVSLLHVELHNLHGGLRQLTIVALILNVLDVEYCFIWRKPVAGISCPVLEKLRRFEAISTLELLLAYPRHFLSAVELRHRFFFILKKHYDVTKELLLFKVVQFIRHNRPRKEIDTLAKKKEM